MHLLEGPQFPIAIGVVVLATYAFALWWFLRGERQLLWLGLIVFASVALRLYASDRYPPGLENDEIYVLSCTDAGWNSGKVFSETCTGIPQLVPVVFSQSLKQHVSARWAIRAYSFLGMTLSVAMMFALARALGLDTSVALAAAGFIAVLPWSLYYGRVWQGGELVLHQLLLLTVLARVLTDESRWPDIWIGAVSFTLAFYTYFCSRSMMLMPLVAVGLRPSWKSFGYGVLITALGLLGWLPFLLHPGNVWTFVGLGPLQVHPDLATDHWRLLEKLQWTLRAFYQPVASPSYCNVLSTNYGAVHPLFLLILAVVGVAMLGFRQALFVLAAFAFSLAPATLSWGQTQASSHRMIQSFPVIALAAAAGLGVLRKPNWVRAAAVVSVALAAGFGIHLFFSDTFWADAKGSFMQGDSWLLEDLPFSDKPIVGYQIPYYHVRPDLDARVTPLTQGNWFPQKASIYALGRRGVQLRPFYEELAGPEHVRTSGDAFWVDFAAPITAPQDVGWKVRMECGATSFAAVVPLVYQLPFPEFPCDAQTPARVDFVGRWVGASEQVRLYSFGDATVDAGGKVYEAHGPERFTAFTAEPDMIIRIHVEWDHQPIVVLLRDNKRSEVPSWRSVVPAP